MTEMSGISEQLRQRRKELGLSLSDVSRRAGTSVAALSRYENGWTRFEVFTLRKLASALDCDLHIALRRKTVATTDSPSLRKARRILKRLFWDHKLSEADFAVRPTWVTERVLEYGNLEDVRLLRDTLGRARFIKTVAAASRLSPRTRSFWNQILTMEGVPCTKKYSRDTAWNC